MCDQTCCLRFSLDLHPVWSFELLLVRHIDLLYFIHPGTSSSDTGGIGRVIQVDGRSFEVYSILRHTELSLLHEAAYISQAKYSPLTPFSLQ